MNLQIKMLFISILLVTSTFLMAESFDSKVHSYDQKYGLIRFENGRVAFLSKKQKISELKLEMIVDQQARITVDLNNEMTSLRIIPRKDKYPFAQKFFTETPPEYQPTILSSKDEALAIFERLNDNYTRRSECSDRAHVWAYDEFKNNGIMTQKVFAFFTASYINRNRFKWWYHVAPLVSVKENNQINQYVLDYTFKDKPVSIKEWTDLMVFSKRDCKITTKFSEYDVNPQTEDCYMMIDSMYYRVPNDLHRQELQSVYRSSFYDYEIQTSRSRAFNAGRN